MGGDGQAPVLWKPCQCFRWKCLCGFCCKWLLFNFDVKVKAFSVESFWQFLYINFSCMYKLSDNYYHFLPLYLSEKWGVFFQSLWRKGIFVCIIGVCFSKVCVYFNLIRRSVQRVHFWTPGQTRSYNLTCACADCCYYHWLEVRPTWKLLSICHASHVCIDFVHGRLYLFLGLS